MDKLDKSYRRFCIEVDEFGTRTPMMIFPTQYSMLIDLGMYDYGKSETITVVLQEIKEALAKKEEYGFSQSDWCIIKVKGEKSEVLNAFDEFPPFEVETSFIVQLLSDWRDFLIKYEKKEIPGLL